VYERSDLSTKLYGAIIYSEHVREALLERHLQKNITGRFTMITENDRRHNEYLEINVELRRGKKQSPNLRLMIRDEVIDTLLKKNAEYMYLTSHMQKRVIPKIVFWPYEHPKHFKGGIKQKWVKINKKTSKRKKT
jgi:hypothetical protein